MPYRRPGSGSWSGRSGARACRSRSCSGPSPRATPSTATPMSWRGRFVTGSRISASSSSSRRTVTSRTPWTATSGPPTPTRPGTPWPPCGFLDETRDAGLADLTGKAVELVAEGRGTERYEEAIKDLDGSAAPSATPDDSAATSAASHSGGSAWWLLIGVPVLALAAALAARGGIRSRKTAPAVPQLVFATARAADEAELRRRAEAEVLALGEATQTADLSTTPGLQHALDAYAASRHGPRRGPGPAGPGGRPGPGPGGP